MSEHARYGEKEFEEFVRSALDDLPIEFQRALDDVAIVVSDRCAEHHAYGLYVGYRLGGRDFGDDPQRLRLQIVQTVRHEVGHHLGFDEAGVRKLGL